MEVEYAAETLPEKLVEKIVAMMPFPSLFKARGLSRLWLARFSSVSSLKGELEKRAATSFQKQVGQRSKNWGTFFPVCHGKEVFSAYDRASKTWRRMPSLDFLPEEVLKQIHSSNYWTEGALLCSFDSKTAMFYVVNIFTRSWKKLPACPDARERSANVVWPLKTGRNPSPETYKLMVLRGKPDLDYFDDFDGSDESDDELGREWSLQIYQSKSDGWSSRTLVEDVYSVGDPVYLDGVVYSVADKNLQKVLAFNVKEGTLEKLTLSVGWRFKFPVLPIGSTLHLVVCDASLFMIVTERDDMETLHVLKVDLESRQLLEVATTAGDGDYLVDNIPSHQRRVSPSSDGHCLFFWTGNFYDSQMVAYDVREDKWSMLDFHWKKERAYNCRTSFHWSSLPFQPGWNPFVEV